MFIKRFTYLACLVVCSLFLMGCPYNSEYKISGAEKVESKYLGTYEKQSSSYYYLVVSKHSDTEYKLEKKKTKTDVVRETAIAYLVKLKGTQFLVVRRQSSGSSYYSSKKNYFYKFTPSKSGFILRLQGVTDYLDKEFESDKELTSYFEKYQDLDFFYQKRVDKYYKADE